MNEYTVGIGAHEPHQQEWDEGYHRLEQLVAERVAGCKESLFTTDTRPTSVWNGYLYNLPEYRRQHYDCRCCRRFIETYGSLVRIDPKSGVARTLLWHDEDRPCIGEQVPFFEPSFVALSSLVSRVTGVFLSSDAVWGTPSSTVAWGNNIRTGLPRRHQGVVWTHLHGRNPSVWKNPVQTAAQAMAEKKQDYALLWHALATYRESLVKQALFVLENDTVARSEKALGVCRWFLELHQKLTPLAVRADYDWKDQHRCPQRNNLVWLAVATAPPGFCHLGNTMIGTLLDDLAQGMELRIVQSRWAAKMHPLQYQRPWSPPSEGTIKQAEKIVEQMKSAGSLERRFARMTDLLTVHWESVDAKAIEREPQTGVFSHLRSQPEQKLLELPPVKMTWEKFCDKVLPTALAVEYQVPSNRAPFFGLVTAADPSAPPILQWDGLAGTYESSSVFPGSAEVVAKETIKAPLPRNPVSWYFYYAGSFARDWNLAAGIWVPVKAVVPCPAHWQRPEQFKHHSEMAMFVLEGCRDLRHEKGSGFFPESLRSEYHGVRSVLEAHANSQPIAGRDEGDANGVAMQKVSLIGQGSGPWLTFRVRTREGLAVYTLDRWD
jgi:hypothetical protein